MTPARSPLRLLRGGMAASLATAVALGGHLVAGAAMPTWLGVALPWWLAVTVCTVLAGTRFSLLRMGVAVLSSQALFHGLFTAGTPGDPSLQMVDPPGPTWATTTRRPAPLAEHSAHTAHGGAHGAAPPGTPCTATPTCTCCCGTSWRRSSPPCCCTRGSRSCCAAPVSSARSCGCCPGLPRSVTLPPLIPSAPAPPVPEVTQPAPCPARGAHAPAAQRPSPGPGRLRAVNPDGRTPVPAQAAPSVDHAVRCRRTALPAAPR